MQYNDKATFFGVISDKYYSKDDNKSIQLKMLLSRLS